MFDFGLPRVTASLFSGACLLLLSAPAIAVTITYSNGQTRATPIVLNPPGDTLDVTSGTATQSGNISESAASSITKTGAGTLNLTGNNSYSGSTNINNGILAIGNTGALGTSGIQMNANGTELLVNTSGTIGNFIGIASNIDTTLAAAHGTNVTFGDVIFGASLVHVGSTGDDGTITLIAQGSLGLFVISVDDGILRPGDLFSSAITHQAGSGMIIGAAGTYDLAGIGLTTANLNGTGHVTNSGGSAATVNIDGGLATFSGVIQDGSSTTALHLSNNTSENLTGANTYTGGTTVDAGSILGGNSTSIQGQITDNGTVYFNQNANGTFTGNISGTGDLTKTGTGTLDLNNANSYSGATNINNGILAIGNTGALGTSSIQMNANGTELLVNTSGTIGNFIGIASNIDTTLAAAHGTNVTFSDVLFGASLVHVGSTGNDGTITLIAQGSVGLFVISVDDGILRPGDLFSSAITHQAGSGLNVGAAGTYDLAGIGLTTANLNGTGHVTNDGGSPATVNIDGGLGTFSGVIQDGTATTALHLSNNTSENLTGANTYTGGSIIDAGSILGGDTTSIQGQITDNGTVYFAQNTNGTFSGNITGTGDLTLSGTGTLNLNAANSYSGVTNINDGTLALGNTGAVGTSGIQLNYSNTQLLVKTSGTIGNFIGIASNIDTTLAAAHGTNVTFGDIMFGQSLVHFGSAGNDGGITFDAQGSLGTFTLSVDDGTLRPGDVFSSAITQQIGSALNIGAAGTYDLNGIGTTTARLTGNGYVTNDGASAATLVTSSSISNFDGNIQDGTSATALHLTNASHLGLFGANTYTGGTIIDVGSMLNGNAASLQGQILNNGGLDFTQNTNGTYAGDISGTGSFVKNGTGSLNLTGNDTFSGATDVFNGRLAVNGSLVNSLVTVASGGTLGGNGTVAGVIANSGSTIGPGNSIGTLHVAGNVAFNAGSIYQVEVNGAGQSDQILATGTATINGGTVQVLAQNGFYGGTTDYTILNATGGVTGTFAAVTSNYAFLTPTLSYDTNNVYLDLASNGLSFQSAAVTPNQVATARAADSLGVGNPVYNTIKGLSVADAQAAYDSLSGEVHASTRTTLLNNAHFLDSALIGRLRQADIGSGNTAAQQLAALDPLQIDTAAGPSFNDAIWGQAFGGWTEIDGDNNAAGTQSSTAGFVMGLDRRITADWRLGIAAGYSHTDESQAARESSATIDSYHIAAYGGGHLGPVAMRAGGAYTFNLIDSSRDVAVGAINDHDKASYNARTAQIFGEIGYDAKIGPLALEPFAGMTYVNLQTDSFTEKGGATALHGRSGSQDLPYATLGLRAGGEIAQLGSATLTAHGMLGWRHAFGDITPTTNLSFASGSSDVTVTGTPIARDALVLQAGLDLAVTDRLAIGLSYDGQLARNSRDHALQAQAKFTF